MPNGIGDKDHVLIQGRIAYGYDGTNAWPLKVTASGSLGVLSTQPIQTIQTELYAAASLAASTQATSSILSLTGTKKATFFIDHGKAATAAFTANGPEYRIEVSEKATGNDTWRPIASVLASSAVAASCAASAGGGAAGTTVINTVAGTAMVLGDIVCWTSGTIEWSKVVAVGGTAQFTILDGLTASHSAATGCFGGAEEFVITLNTESLTRARVVINNNASAGTQPIVSRVACITS